MVGTLISYTDPNLLHGDEGHIAFSPFTMVFQQLPRFGYYAANLMNAVILSSVLSCGNSSMYVASRMLHAMSHSGKAPRMFGRLNGRGVPVVGALGHGSGQRDSRSSRPSSVSQKIYQVLYNASSLSGFLIWLGIAVCHLRFRKAWVAQGRTVSRLKFRVQMFILTARGSRSCCSWWCYSAPTSACFRHRYSPGSTSSVAISCCRHFWPCIWATSCATRHESYR